MSYQIIFINKQQTWLYKLVKANTKNPFWIISSNDQENLHILVRAVFSLPQYKVALYYHYVYLSPKSKHIGALQRLGLMSSTVAIIILHRKLQLSTPYGQPVCRFIHLLLMLWWNMSHTSWLRMVTVLRQLKNQWGIRQPHTLR